MLEEAVRWVIILIIFVFDPLAVLLLIASQYTFDFARNNNRGLAWREYEQARAQKIVENSHNDKERDNGPEHNMDQSDGGDEKEQVQEESKEEETKEDTNDVVQPVEPAEEVIEKKDSESSVESKSDLDNWNEWVEAANAEAAKEAQQEGMLFGEDNLKKTEIKERATLVQKYEQDNAWSEAKRIWKSKNPDQNIKDWKHAYISGRIHELPWQQYLNYQDQEVQDALESRIKPDLTEVIEPAGYKQNEEQSEDSVWSKIRDKDK